LTEEETPDDPTKAAAQAEATETEVAEGCENDNAKLLRYMGTSYVVDDLEAIRVALGDEPLHYLGLSYGTRIGAIYADRYPEHAGTIVLDGSVSPDSSLTTLTMGQFNGISRAYDRFLSDCAATPSCPLNPDPSAAVNAALDAVTQTPMVYTGEEGPEDLDDQRFMTGLITSLYDPSAATATAQAIAAITGSGSDGTYDNGLEVQAIVTCADAPQELTSSEAETLRAEILAKGGPLADTFATGGKACFALPVDEGKADITSTTAAKKILIIGTTGDPATPIEWTSQMAEALGTRSVITYEGRGHTASLRIPCVTDAVVKFLSTGATSTTNCALDPDETDVYLTVGKQFEQLGLPAGSAACIATELRGKVDELSLVSDSEDPDPNLITVMQRATRTCSTGG
jgi:pimeloyl-ACP methyl ester carboxylesterase